jgi:dihydropteroate synthase
VDGRHQHVILMGIVNVTPDSFSDGGRFVDAEAAVAHARRLIADGADWLDIGGESTRPGAPAVAADEELARVLPVIRALHDTDPDVPISIDTSKASVAAAALAAGASIVNDVTAHGDPAMAGVVAAAGASTVLMHMRGNPRTMQHDTAYGDMVGEVARFLAGRAREAILAGVPADRILLDPGVGFGKSSADNPRLIAAIPKFRALGHRVVVGASRKRFIGELTGVTAADQRVYGSIGAALAAAALGADVLRVHDVGATRQALTVWRAIREAEGEC